MSAYEIYDLCKDMDFMDYEETYESDIAFIQALIDAIGDKDALSVLREMRRVDYENFSGKVFCGFGFGL